MGIEMRVALLNSREKDSIRENETQCKQDKD